jgi:pilus assembly protein Flp/PilA
MRGLLARFIGDHKATTAIEYGLIAALIATVMIAGLNALGNNLNGQLIVIGTSLD